MQRADVDSIRRMASLATPMTLRVAVTLGLPDRLLGHLVTLGVAERTSDGYRTTSYGANLCTDAGNGLTDLLHLDSAGGRAELAFVELAHSISTGQAAYPRRYGQDFWTDLAQHPLPSVADDYLLCDVLHNWDDEQAHTILARCVEAARPGSRVLVIEAVAGQYADSEIDLAMLVQFGGRERSAEQFRDLTSQHGLTLVSVTGLTSQRCLLEFELR